MAIKLLALDIDDTLAVRLGNTVSPRNLAAIRAAQQRGVFVTIATGRASYSTRPFWEALDLHGPSIQFGGAWIVEAPSGKLLDQQPLSPEHVCAVLQFAHDIGVHTQIYVDDVLYTESENAFTRNYSQKSGMPVIIEPELRFQHFSDIPKILAFSNPEDEPRMRALFMERFSNTVHVARSQSTFIEINDFHATKGHALERLAKRMGVAQNEVAAMGDSYLDIDMLQWAGTGVCMADSVDEVVRASDLVAPACDDDGVAWYIENYILK